MKNDKQTKAIASGVTKIQAWPFPNPPLYDINFNEWWEDRKATYTESKEEKEILDGINKVLETDPNGLSLNTPGAKADAGKNRAWLFLAGFSNALEEVAKVTTIGANKYTPNGWVDVPDGQSRYMDAFARHLFKLGGGEVLDTGEGGTGCYHKAQMIWNLLASLELELREQKK